MQLSRRFSRGAGASALGSRGAGPGQFLLVSVAFALCASCFHPRTSTYHRPRGTCESACDYYLSCKNDRDNTQVAEACVSECRTVFTDPFVLRAIERLSCDKIVSFVEGPSGRGPGDPVR